MRHALTAAPAIVLALALSAATAASAQLTLADIFTFRPLAEQPSYGRQTLAKARPDECFAGIGVDYPPLNPDGSCSAGQPKVNQSYVWGLTQAGLGEARFAGDEIWFGTIANPLCDGAAGVLTPPPALHTAWVCEYGQSMLARRPVAPMPAAAGDWRPPRIYSYRLSTGLLTERTAPRDPALKTVTGFRSAGALGRMVFVAGPDFQAQVVFAAYDAGSGAYKGSCRASELKNIRSWLVVNGVLYAGAGRRPGDGVLLRWRGTPDDPFNGAASPSPLCGFEVVGTLPDLPAYLASYDGKRIAATVWADSHRESAPGAAAGSNPFTAGLYLGPPLGSDGAYDATDAKRRWLRLWSPADYDPDPVVAGVTGGGALAFWRGWLWFGTMHNSAGALTAHTRCTLPACFGPPQNDDEQLALLLGASRAASLWRARIDEQGRPVVELLYGATELPAFVPGTRVFENRPTGWTPRFGGSGMGNPFLTYAWSANAGPDDLLFGFYDYRYVFDVNFGIIPDPAPTSDVDPRRGYGGDLWRFTDPEAPARPEATAGLTDFSNYGVRNMLRLEGGEVIAGIANALNLEPRGGWELIRLSPPAAARQRGPGRK
ncbi:MAG: hypothetical protein Fur0014_10270 [Rubrivivax sp.]